MNRKEINQYIRAKSKKTCNNKRCYMCNSNKDVQIHHLIKVEDLTHIAYHNDYNTREKIDTMYIPTVPLCDSDHKLIHSLSEDNFMEVNIDLNKLYKIVNLIGEIDFSNVNEDLLDDYNRIYFEMLDNIVFNFLKNNDLTEDEMQTAENILRENLNIEIMNEEVDEDEGLD